MEILSNLYAGLMVALVLGFVIFIHELGHFLLAKWNDVKVEKFAVGFDIFNLKLFSRKIGETTYVLGALPLGGYVKMLGEDMTGTSQDGPPISDPRAYPNKPVGARMAIISAGVIMNILFGFLAFSYLYTRESRYIPPVLGHVVAGMPAYQAGLQAGDKITAINGHEIDRFTALRQAIIFNSRGEKISATVQRPGVAEPINISVSPQLRAGGMSQTIGISPSTDLDLSENLPFLTPAALGNQGEEIRERLSGGYTVVGAGPVGEAPQAVKTRQELNEVLASLVGQPVELSLSGSEKKKIEPFKVTLPPVDFVDLGMRMTPGTVTGVRAGSPAEAAGLKEGDRILAVNGEADFDPIRLPDLTYKQAEEKGQTVLKVERSGQPGQSETLTLDPIRRRSGLEESIGDESLDVAPLGFALGVNPTVASVVEGSPAEKAGIKPGDVIKRVIFKLQGSEALKKLAKQVGFPATVKFVLDGKRDSKDEISGSWPSVFDQIQRFPAGPVEIQLAGSDQTLSLNPAPRGGWHHPRRGLQFLTLTQKLPAQSVAGALRLGWDETVSNATSFYSTLRSLYQGTLSKDAVGGPLKIGEMAYTTAKIGLEAFLPFLAMLSINLAVVNFLPIPPLDGGQLLFLICEKVRGRPVPEKYAGPVMLAGLLLILLLFVVVNLNDVLSYFGS